MLIVSCFLLLILFSTRCASAAPPDVPMTLPNGMQIILRERHDEPLVALDLWMRAGSRDENKGEEGCAHFLEHTLFKGTATRQSTELDFVMESLGGVFTAATGPDYAHYGATVPPAALESALGLLSELVRNAALPEAEIERERAPILDELAIHSADVQAMMPERAYTLAYASHPYRRAPGGTPDDIRARTRAELLAFYQRCYTPERAILVLVGDFDSDAAKAAIGKIFGDWKRSANDAEAITVAAEQAGDGTHFSGEKTTGSAGKIVVGFRVPPASDAAATRALRLIDALLGSSDTGGMLAVPALAGTRAESRYTPRHDSSLFLITADLPPGADTDRRDQIAAAIREVLRKLQNYLTSPAALQSARQQVLAQVRRDGETNAGLARLLGYAVIVHADPPETLPRVLPLVKSQDITKAALRYLNWERLIEMTVTPRVAPKEKPAK